MKQHADSRNLAGMARFGITTANRFGASVPAMRTLAKGIGTHHPLALALWKTGIAEARIVASMIDDPRLVTGRQMDEWVRGFNSWDVCDQVCMNLFEKTPLSRKKIRLWAARQEEYVRRAAFALIACIAWHDRSAPDSIFIGFFPVLKRGAMDERNYVRKAVSWALRTIGKRNGALHRAAIRLARDIRSTGSKPALWVASDVLRELEREAVRSRVRARDASR